MSTLTAEERERGARLLRALPGFELFPPEKLAELAARLEGHDLPAGAAVVREGDRGDRCFCVVVGRCEVHRFEDRSASLGELGEGEWFGELALFLESGTRQASVTALTPTRLFSLDRVSFRAVLEAHPHSREAVQRRLDQLLRAPFVAEVGGDRLDAQQRQALGARVTSRTVGAGEFLICTGEPGDHCLMLRLGRAEVLVEGDDGLERAGELAAGAVLGKDGFLTGEPATVSVRALEPCELLELHRDALLETVGDDPKRVRSFLGGRPRSRRGS